MKGIAEIKEIVARVEKKFEELPPLSKHRCIYKVPRRLREINEKAYTPKLVSIGPFHRGKKELQAMEKHKTRYLKLFIEKGSAQIEEYTQEILEKEDELRNCYDGSIDLDSEEFVEMVLADASFIIILFLFVPHRNKIENPIFNQPWMLELEDPILNQPWMIDEIKEDLILLENQLPFFIINDLFKLFHKEGASFIAYAYLSLYCCHYFWVKENSLLNRDFSRLKHFVDFLRICTLPSNIQSPENENHKKIWIPSATQLHQVGVKFQLSSSNNIFDIEFNRGVLKIPQLYITDSTEILLRNMHAFEQCHVLIEKRYLSHYLAFMAMLLADAKDVELLARKEIVENWLRDDKALSSLFHDLVKGNIISRRHYYFSSLIEQLNGYYKSPWQQRKAKLKRNYFNSPWAGLSVFAAIILLILTIIQTVCSILQVK